MAKKFQNQDSDLDSNLFFTSTGLRMYFVLALVAKIVLFLPFLSLCNWKYFKFYPLWEKKGGEGGFFKCPEEMAKPS